MCRKRKNKNSFKLLFTLIAIICIGIIGYFNPDVQEYITNNFNLENEVVYTSSSNTLATSSFDLSSIPEYTNKPYVILNNNKPEFEESDFKTESFENYSDLDSLGRCGVAFACLSIDTMPSADDERESISNVEPSGWINKKYESVDGGYLYNRCHLIGYQLSNENANEKNLITGTRYFNVEGMLPFENQVAEYIKNQKENEDKHVLYRVTPIYYENNLVASGVQMEAYSVEDEGKSICFNVFIYNVQPGININYETGESQLIEK